MYVEQWQCFYVFIATTFFLDITYTTFRIKFLQHKCMQIFDKAMTSTTAFQNKCKNIYFKKHLLQ